MCAARNVRYSEPRLVDCGCQGIEQAVGSGLIPMCQRARKQAFMSHEPGNDAESNGQKQQCRKTSTEVRVAERGEAHENQYSQDKPCRDLNRLDVGSHRIPSDRLAVTRSRSAEVVAEHGLVHRVGILRHGRHAGLDCRSGYAPGLDERVQDCKRQIGVAGFDR